jgi:hypothetical protein
MFVSHFGALGSGVWKIADIIWEVLVRSLGQPLFMKRG